MRYRESETLSKREHAIDLREGKRKGKFGKKIINKGIEKKKNNSIGFRHFKKINKNKNFLSILLISYIK